MIRGFKSSRIRENREFQLSATTETGLLQLFSLVGRPVRPLLASRKLRLSFKNEGKLYETDTGTLQNGGAGFQTTHWTLVLRARQTQSDTSAQKALSNFCEAYSPPLYAFLRHRGHASPEAQDLVQGSSPI